MTLAGSIMLGLDLSETITDAVINKVAIELIAYLKWINFRATINSRG